MLKGFLLAVPLVTTMACATMPKSGVQSNGEQLRVAVEDRQYSYAVKEKVGDATHRDASGNVIGTTEITRTAIRTQRYKVWDFYQGRQLLDEADFFRLAGDQPTSDLIIKRRRKGMTYNRIGLYTALGGGIVMIGGILLSSTSPAARNGLTTLGSLSLTVGGVMAYYGKGMVERRHMPLNRALDVYDAYMANGGGM